VGFHLCDRAVLNAFWDDKYLAWTKANVSVSNKEEVIRFIMLMPYEWPLDLDNHEIVANELPDRSGLEVLGEQGELRCVVEPFMNCPCLAGSGSPRGGRALQ
jgi:hypothetical protein